MERRWERMRFQGGMEIRRRETNGLCMEVVECGVGQIGLRNGTMG